MSRLDESKPFGQVFGGYAGIRYEQDGRLFNGQKQQVDAEGKVIAPTKGGEQAQESTKPEAPAKAAAPKKPASKKSQPSGVKSMREQAQEDAQPKGDAE